MRVTAALLVFAFVAIQGALADDGPKKKKRTPPPPGIRWHADLNAGLARAVAEGRPILFAVNAREDERANIELATRQYRSREWGQATREYVAFVCNPNDHKGADGMCTRYPGIKCETHKAALQMVARRFGSDLITPQHIILEPDQRLAYRKEYYTRVVRPSLLEGWLSAIAPDIAFSRAGIVREKQIESILSTPVEERPAKIEAWSSSPDGLAAAALTHVLDGLLDPAERMVVLNALAKTDARQAPVLELIAEDRIAYPDEEVAETVAWIQALLRIRRPLGLRAAARALCRSEEAKVRGQILRACVGTAHVDLKTVAEKERYVLWEALALAGDERGGPTAAPMPADGVWRRRIERALRRGGLATGAVPVDLAAALQRPDDLAGLHRALLQATGKQTGEHRAAIEQLLDTSRWLGLRVAAAVALLRAGLETQGEFVARTLRAALFDAIEGPDVRRSVQELLGEDPGTNVDEWIRMIQARTRKPESK